MSTSRIVLAAGGVGCVGYLGVEYHKKVTFVMRRKAELQFSANYHRRVLETHPDDPNIATEHKVSYNICMDRISQYVDWENKGIIDQLRFDPPEYANRKD